MPERKFKAGKAFWILALLVLTGAIAYQFIGFERNLPLLPVPNGNDDFVKAQNLLVGNPADFKRGSIEDLRKHLDENAEALKLVRAGLAKQCRVPIVFSTNYLNLRSLGDVKRIARLLEAEGQLAELERRTNDAARIYLEIIRFGKESCRGGLLMDRLVGIACESIGVSSLQRIAGALNSKTSRSLSKQLDEVKVRQEAVADVVRSEAEWVRRTFPVWQRIPAMIPIGSQATRMQNDFSKKCHQSELQLAFLIVDLATHAFELDRGRHPKIVNELVPDYLDSVPVDPATGKELAYPK